eukprot:s449_g2.t1
MRWSAPTAAFVHADGILEVMQANPAIPLKELLPDSPSEGSPGLRTRRRIPVLRGLLVDSLSFGTCVRTTKVLSLFPRYFVKSELEHAIELGFEGSPAEVEIRLEPGECMPVHPPASLDISDRLYFRHGGLTSEPFSFQGLDGVEHCRTFHVYRDRSGDSGQGRVEPRFVQVDIQKTTFPAKNHVPLAEGYFLVLRPRDFRSSEDLLFHFDNQTPYSYFATISGGGTQRSSKLLILEGGMHLWQHLFGYQDADECLKVQVKLIRDNAALREHKPRPSRALVSLSLGDALTSRNSSKPFALEASLRLTAAYLELAPGTAEEPTDLVLAETLAGSSYCMARWHRRLRVQGEFVINCWRTQSFVPHKARVDLILEDLNRQKKSVDPEVFVAAILSVEACEGEQDAEKGKERVTLALGDKWQVCFVSGDRLRSGMLSGSPAWRQQLLEASARNEVIELQTHLELTFSTTEGGAHNFTVKPAPGWSGPAVRDEAEGAKEKASWNLSINVPVLSVSWIHRHEEVLAVRVKGIKLEVGQHATDRSFDIGMQHLQVDHFMDGGELPVVLNRRFLHINSRWLREKAVQLSAKWISDSHIIKKLSVSLVPYWLNLELGVLIRLLDLAESSLGVNEASPDEGARVALAAPSQPSSLADAKHLEVWRLETLVVQPLRLTIMVRSPDTAAARDHTMARRIRFLPVDMPNMDLKVDQTVLTNQFGSIQQLLGTLGNQYKRKARNSALLSVTLSYMAAILKGSMNALWWLARGPYDAVDAALPSAEERRPWFYWVEPLVQGLAEGTYRAFAELVGNSLFGIVLVLNSIRQLILGVPRPRAQSFLDGILLGFAGLVIDTFLTPARQLVLQTQALRARLPRVDTAGIPVPLRASGRPRLLGSARCGAIPFSHPMLRIRMLSGEEVASMPVGSLSNIKALKQHLTRFHGLPTRFRQKLLFRGTPLDDSTPLDSPLELDLVLLSYSVSSKDEAKELVTVFANGSVSEAESILQQPRHPDMVNARGFSPVMLASQGGHVDVLRLLLEAEADINLFDNDGFTALTGASAQGEIEVLRLLLEAGADMDVASHEGVTALMLASQGGHVEVVRLLLDAGAEKNSASNDGFTALMRASQSGHAEVLRILLAAGAHKNSADNDGVTALMGASLQGDTEVLRLLLEAGAEKNLASSSHTLTALMMASDNGHEDVVRLLLETGVEKNSADNDGFTALTRASQDGHLEVVRMLLEAGADENLASNDGVTALALSSEYGHVAVVRLLLEAGAHKNSANKDGFSALMLASEQGHADVVSSLLQAGADKNLANSNGVTALMLASDKGLMEVAQVLLEAGADKTSADNDGYTTLIRACYYGRVEVLHWLLEAGADKNSVDNYGYNALMWAAEQGHADVVSSLLQEGAEKNLANNNGFTALMLASEQGHVAVAQLLLEADADKNSFDNCAYGYTALMWASEKGHADVVSSLLQAGADKNFANSNGVTALTLASMASDKDHVKVVRLLQEDGAETNLAKPDAAPAGSDENTSQPLPDGGDRLQVAYHDWGIFHASIVFVLCLLRISLGPALGVLHLAASSIEGLANLLLHEEAQFAPFETQRSVEPISLPHRIRPPGAAQTPALPPPQASPRERERLRTREASLHSAGLRSSTTTMGAGRTLSAPGSKSMGTGSMRIGEAQQSWWKRKYGSLKQMLTDDDAVMDRVQLPVQYALNP